MGVLAGSGPDLEGAGTPGGEGHWGGGLRPLHRRRGEGLGNHQASYNLSHENRLLQ